MAQGDFRPSPIGDEAARAREALTLAAQRQHVALLGSGDAGVYGLAGLVYEIRATMEWQDAPPTVEVIPGVTAATAAAALLGAPLGHDFAVISLSDLLTPWEVIARRLEAAAEADFVIALYNPASRARRAQFEAARAILLRRRPPATPVGIVTDASRPGERTVITDLGSLAVDEVSMLSIVIVGNSHTAASTDAW
ncbi:MAG: precorrin-3B C(17)-methyltransferase [Dehalococcoidia bacterium]